MPGLCFLFLIPSFHLLLSHTLTLNGPSLSGAVNWYQLPTSARRVYPAAQRHGLTASSRSCLFQYDCLPAWCSYFCRRSNGQSYTNGLMPVSQMRWGKSARPGGQRRHCNTTHPKNPKPKEQVPRLSLLLCPELSSPFTANTWSAASPLKSEPLSDVWRPLKISANQLQTKDSLDTSVKLFKKMKKTRSHSHQASTEGLSSSGGRGTHWKFETT